MKYRDKKIKDVCSEQLLFELIKRNGTGPCPTSTKYHGDWIDITVGIGTDYTAQVRLPTEDLVQLEKLVSCLEEG